MVSVDPACVARVSARVCRLFALRSFNNHYDDGKNVRIYHYLTNWTTWALDSLFERSIRNFHRRRYLGTFKLITGSETLAT